MENLTNFDTLIYIYIAMTIGTLIYPVQLWFRVNFVNFIFMILILSFTLIFNIELNLIFNDFFNIENIYFILSNIMIVFLSIIYFRVYSDITRIDSLFLGYIPSIILFEGILLYLSSYSNGFNIFLLNVSFFLFYSGIIYQKLLFTLPFTVNIMGRK